MSIVNSIPIANSLFLVTSFYSDNSYIFDPKSNVKMGRLGGIGEIKTRKLSVKSYVSLCYNWS